MCNNDKSLAEKKFQQESFSIVKVPNSKFSFSILLIDLSRWVRACEYKYLLKCTEATEGSSSKVMSKNLKINSKINWKPVER